MIKSFLESLFGKKKKFYKILLEYENLHKDTNNLKQLRLDLGKFIIGMDDNDFKKYLIDNNLKLDYTPKCVNFKQKGFTTESVYFYKKGREEIFFNMFIVKNIPYFNFATYVDYDDNVAGIILKEYFDKLIYRTMKL